MIKRVLLSCACSLTLLAPSAAGEPVHASGTDILVQDSDYFDLDTGTRTETNADIVLQDGLHQGLYSTVYIKAVGPTKIWKAINDAPGKTIAQACLNEPIPSEVDEPLFFGQENAKMCYETGDNRRGGLIIREIVTGTSYTFDFETFGTGAQTPGTSSPQPPQSGFNCTDPGVVTYISGTGFNPPQTGGVAQPGSNVCKQLRCPAEHMVNRYLFGEAAGRTVVNQSEDWSLTTQSSTQRYEFVTATATSSGMTCSYRYPGQSASGVPTVDLEIETPGSCEPVQGFGAGSMVGAVETFTCDGPRSQCRISCPSQNDGSL